MNKIFISLISIALLAGACGDAKKSEESAQNTPIDMSDEMLMSDESPLTEMPEYSKQRPGESSTFDRSFENAPPLIPHRVSGFLPIKIDDNKCLWCHMPDKAPEFKATPLPKTHLTSYRPRIVEEDGKYRVDAEEGQVVETDLGRFNSAMFNCSQCHVPQAQVTVEIPNIFDPDYRGSKEKSRSNLKDKMGEGVR